MGIQTPKRGKIGGFLKHSAIFVCVRFANTFVYRMGAYEDYMKSLSAAGMGPQRPVEVEPQAKPHAFGNPFKIDKKNMSIIDEVIKTALIESSKH